MTSPTALRTPYTLRLQLVKDAITAHSKLGDDDAGDLAALILTTLNSIPEKVR